MSDAGTPCISDPGHFLVSAAAAAGIRVIPVPGACAALSALVVTGFALSTFAFVGFLPRSGSARTASLARVAASDGAVVIYEAPGRVRGTIDALEGVVGDREVVVAREITKKFEEVRRFASVSEAAVEYAECEDEPRGEFVIVVGPAKSVRKMEGVHDEMETADVNVRGMARALLEEGVPVKAIAKSIGSVANLSKKAVYKYVSDLKDEMLLSPTPARNT